MVPKLASQALKCLIKGLNIKKMESFKDILQKLFDEVQKSSEIEVGKIFKILSGKGYPALLILLSLPFCLPLQIPGASTPFGIILGFMGLRIAFGKRLWWPKWILEKQFKSEHIKTLIKKSITFIDKVQKLARPRLIFLAKNPLLHRMHGLLVFCLSLILALPLPIPFSNMLAAFPIFFMGWGLLEDDGVLIILAYIFTTIFFLAFLGLFLIGKAQLAKGFI